MILVLASPRDPAAAALVAGWAGARLLTPADLSLSGWVLPAGPSTSAGPHRGRGMADGQPFSDEEVSCVVALTAGVEPEDLGWIDPQHRAYVAGEMTAFLGHWLTTLGERCLVAPSWASLAGPTPPTAAWARAAGLPLSGGAGADRCVLTVIGDRVFRIGATQLPLPRSAVTDRMLRAATSYDAAVISVVVDAAEPLAERPHLHAVLPAPVVRGRGPRAALRGLVASRLVAAVAS